MRSKRSLLAMSAVTLVIAGCEQSTEPEAALTASEAAEIALAFDELAGGAVDANANSSASLSLAPGDASMDAFSQTDGFDMTRPCPMGGTIRFDGSWSLRIDSDAGTIEHDVSANGLTSSCAFETESGDDVTLTGTVAFTADRAIARGVGITGAQTYEGTLNYVTGDGSTGMCEIDMQTELAAGSGSGSRVVTGTFCGQTIDSTALWAR